MVYHSNSTPMSRVGEVDELQRIGFDLFGCPLPIDVRPLHRAFRWVNSLRNPWDGVLVLGVAFGLYIGILLACTLIILWDGSLVSLVIGVPTIGCLTAMAAHLVPPHTFELVE
jgi:hypothetical protein